LKRRKFLQSTAAVAGAAALTGRAASGSAQGITDLIPPASKTNKRTDAPAPISEAEREQRREKARTLMRQLGFAAMLIEPGANMEYFAGIQWGRSERLFAFLLPVSGRPIVIAPGFERQRAEDQVNNRYDLRVWQEDQNPETLVADTLSDLGLATDRLAIDPSARTFVLTELAANVSAEMKKLGYDGGALVLFGESSAYPHGLPHPRALQENQVVLVDGGLSVNGYQSDMTRTVVFGTPTAEMQKVFDIVHEAQAKSLAFAAPGKKCGDVDAVARKVITDAGYGPDYRTFTHRLGHGIGLEGHEWPYLVRGSQIILEPGMTFSDEPGIYQYGKFGIRLEDIMAITESGAEMMTPRQKSLVASEI
jgi:Xaa-Pro dipeptidase